MKNMKTNVGKVLKLKNRYTGDIVETKNYDDVTHSQGNDFIKVYNPSNPSRVYLANKEAFTVVS